MQPNPSRLPYLLGVLLIIAGPALFIGQVVKNNSGGHTTHSTAHILGKNQHDTTYTLHVTFDGPIRDSLVQDEIKTSEGDREIDSVEKEKQIPVTNDITQNREKAMKYALERKTQVEQNGEELPNGTVMADIPVSKPDFEKYKAGDSVEVVYAGDEYAKARLKKDWAALKQKKAGSWLMASGLIFFLGIVLVVRARRRAAQEPPVDMLNTYTYSSIKKDNSSSGGQAPGPF